MLLLSFNDAKLNMFKRFVCNYQIPAIILVMFELNKTLLPNYISWKPPEVVIVYTSHPLPTLTSKEAAHPFQFLY